jgi:hypothetical protein
VLSGVPVFPLRVWIWISVPGGNSASQRTRPQLETVSVSFAFEVKVPRPPAPGSRTWTFPGLDVARNTSPLRARTRLVSCSAGKDEIIVHDLSGRTR